MPCTMQASTSAPGVADSTATDAPGAPSTSAAAGADAAPQGAAGSGAAASASAPGLSGAGGAGDTAKGGAVVDIGGGPEDNRPRAGTLVIAPTSLLAQWEREIKKKVSPHACVEPFATAGLSRTQRPWRPRLMCLAGFDSAGGQSQAACL